MTSLEFFDIEFVCLQFLISAYCIHLLFKIIQSDISKVKHRSSN